MVVPLFKKLVSEGYRVKLREFYYRVTSWYYMGRNYYCIGCDRSYRRFLPHGNAMRQNARCPHCLSLERTRVLHYYLIKETDILQAQCTVLHFAPEQSLFHLLVKKGNRYVDIDINPAYARHVGDITDLSFVEETFDYILCSHVLAHIKEEAIALQNLWRVLKPGGSLIIMTKLDRELTYASDELISISNPHNFDKEYPIYRLHGFDYLSMLETYGFDVTASDYRMEFSEQDRQRFALGDGLREVVILCKKR